MKGQSPSYLSESVFVQFFFNNKIVVVDILIIVIAANDSHNRVAIWAEHFYRLVIIVDALIITDGFTASWAFGFDKDAFVVVIMVVVTTAITKIDIVVVFIKNEIFDVTQIFINGFGIFGQLVEIILEGFDFLCHVVDAIQEGLDKIALELVFRQLLAFCQSSQIRCVL